MTALLHSLKAIVEVRGNKTLWLRNSSLFAYNHTGALIQTDSTASPLKIYYIFQHSIFSACCSTDLQEMLTYLVKELLVQCV